MKEDFSQPLSENGDVDVETNFQRFSKGDFQALKADFQVLTRNAADVLQISHKLTHKVCYLFVFVFCFLLFLWLLNFATCGLFIHVTF